MHWSTLFHLGKCLKIQFLGQYTSIYRKKKKHFALHAQVRKRVKNTQVVVKTTRLPKLLQSGLMPSLCEGVPRQVILGR